MQRMFSSTWRLIPLLVLTISGLSGCNQATLAGYQRCPDPKEFPHLSCCKKTELFSKEDGGCAIPENIRPQRQKQVSPTPKELPPLQTPMVTELPQLTTSNADISAQLSAPAPPMPKIIPEKSSAATVIKTFMCLALYGLTIATSSSPAPDPCNTK